MSTILITLMLGLNFSSCKKDDNPGNSSKKPNTVNIQQGNWKVTNYNNSGKDETYYFKDYTFTFNPSGIASAIKNSMTENGTWSNGTDDSQHKFILNFGSLQPLNKLNDDWHILEETSVKLRLEDISGGNGGIDYLTFEK